MIDPNEMTKTTHEIPATLDVDELDSLRVEKAVAEEAAAMSHAELLRRELGDAEAQAHGLRLARGKLLETMTEKYGVDMKLYVIKDNRAMLDPRAQTRRLQAVAQQTDRED
tara:strand:- start:128 stop:460 length:333 start_codon:yes stop_codon:yes gene_type:complete